MSLPSAQLFREARAFAEDLFWLYCRRRPACGIATWQQFSRRIRQQPGKMLKRLPDLPDAVLVSGCQRSGTTMMAQVIGASDEIVFLKYGRDDELYGALVLAGLEPHAPCGRYCLQTTYLNDRYPEYFEHRGGFRLVWVLRNPLAVVYSMVYRWQRFGLNELFEACGRPWWERQPDYQARPARRFSVLERACLAYCGKVSQFFELREQLGDHAVAAVDYDELVTARDHIVPAVYRFLELNYRPEHAAIIHAQSLDYGNRLFPPEARKQIQAVCGPVYERARGFRLASG